MLTLRADQLQAYIEAMTPIWEEEDKKRKEREREDFIDKIVIIVFVLLPMGAIVGALMLGICYIFHIK